MPIIHREDGVSSFKARIVIYDETHTDNVASGNYSTTTITPPKGVLWRIKSMYLRAFAPAGAASGLHQYQIGNAISLMLSGTSAFGSDVEWDASVWKTADIEKTPSDQNAALTALLNTSFDHNNPIVVVYSNYTNVSANDIREVEFAIEEESIR